MTKLFFKVTNPFVPTTSEWEFLLPASPTVSHGVVLLGSAHSNRCVMLSPSFNLHFPNYTYHETALYTPLASSNISGEMSAKVFDPFFIIFFLIRCVFKKFSPCLWFSFYSFDSVFHRGKNYFKEAQLSIILFLDYASVLYL